MTSVAVNTYTHSVTYVADNILKSFKDIIRLSGLDPSNLVASWESKMRALRTWLDTGDLERVVLEVFNPKTGTLIVRWDIDVVYNWSSGDGSFWTDTEQLISDITSARRGWRLATPATRCCCIPNLVGRTSRAGRRVPIARPTAWCGTASARPSSTAASAATPPIGGRPDAVRRRGIPKIQEPA